MRYVYPCIEQLDRASSELKVTEPVSARLALILTDNVVELIAHRRCKDIFAQDAAYRYDEPPQYSFKIRREVLGQHFDKKINFLLQRSEITSDEHLLAQYAHRIRNEAYHVGLVHDAIIHSLAWKYHELACVLFARLRPSYFSSSSSTQVPPAVQRHSKKLGAKAPGRMIVDLDAASASLAEERPPLSESLQASLVNSALTQVDEVEANLDFICSNAPNGPAPRSEVLREALYWKALSEGLAEVESPRGSKEYAAEFRRVKESLSNWAPKTKTLPLPSWRKRAARLTSVRDAGAAVTAFEALSRNMADVAQALEDQALSLDAHIQAQIDHARGK